MKLTQDIIKVFAFYKKKSSLIKKVILISGMGLLFLDFAIFTLVSQGNLLIWLYSIPIALIIFIILIILINILLHKLNKNFKEDFIKNLVKNLPFDCIHTYNEIINKNDLVDSSLLNYNDNYSYSFIDNLEGTIYEYKFRSSFLTIKKIDKQINYTPFKGRIFIIDYLSNVDFLVYEKNSEYSPGLKNIVYNDDIINIYSDSINTVNKVIKPQTINKLSKLLEKNKMKISIEFKKDKIYLSLWNNKDNYNLSEMTTINNIEQDYLHEINVIKVIIDALDL